MSLSEMFIIKNLPIETEKKADIKNSSTINKNVKPVIVAPPTTQPVVPKTNSTTPFKQDQEKKKLLFESTQDNCSYQAGWLVLSDGIAYEKRLIKDSSLFIFKEGSSWILWRGSWISPANKKKGETVEQKLRSERTLAVANSFQQVFKRGEQYLKWWKGLKKEK